MLPGEGAGVRVREAGAVSPLAWLITFGVIGLLSVVGLLAIGWYARRAMEEHQRQVKEILSEMRQVMEEEGDIESAAEDDEIRGSGGSSSPAAEGSSAAEGGSSSSR